MLQETAQDVPSSEPVDLNFVVEQLRQPPFNRHQLSVIQLHDEWTTLQLAQLIQDVLYTLDPHVKGKKPRLDVRNEQPEETVARMCDYLRVFKFPMAADSNLPALLIDGDRPTMLQVLYFLLKDKEMHTKRAYLAPFLTRPEVPQDILMDSNVYDMLEQLKQLQQEFIEVHKYHDQTKSAGQAINELKKEIQLMEDEKQQVLGKLTRLRKRADDMPNHEVWLEAARQLRLQQQQSQTLSQRLAEQREQVDTADARYVTLQGHLREAKTASQNATAESLLSKLRDETASNQFMAQDQYPKMIAEKRQQLDQMRAVLSQPVLTVEEEKQMTRELQQLTERLAQESEKQRQAVASAGTNEDKVELFRQQAALLARKRDEKSDLLKAKLAEMQQLAKDTNERQEKLTMALQFKALKGDEFKNYVTDLRAKSNRYKLRKAELTALQNEIPILKLTVERIQEREGIYASKIQEMEQKRRENMDEDALKANDLSDKTLDQIKEMLQGIILSINTKKTAVAPVIQQLRDTRQRLQELEAVHAEKKRVFDASLVGLDTELRQINNDLRTVYDELSAQQQRYHILNMQINLSDMALDKILFEMKAYLGGDEAIESLQKQRGFKSYRDLFQRHLAELEHETQNLRATQDELDATYPFNVHQKELFVNVKQLLDAKRAGLQQQMQQSQSQNLMSSQRGINQSARPSSFSTLAEQSASHARLVTSAGRRTNKQVDRLVL